MPYYSSHKYVGSSNLSDEKSREFRNKAVDKRAAELQDCNAERFLGKERTISVTKGLVDCEGSY